MYSRTPEARGSRVVGALGHRANLLAWEHALGVMAKQISVLVENRPGSLAEVAEILAENGINVEAIMLEGSLDFGVLRVQVDSPKAANTALTSAGFQVTMGDIIVLELPNRPGELARVCNELNESGVNIEVMFGTTSGADNGAELVIKTSDDAAARRALGLS